MAHIALYREFRPQTFDEVIGQDHIVKTLQNQIKNQSTSHAYLFCGTRGTGKTSCAKIFAKAVNCLQPENGSPCGKCKVCQSITANGNLDIMEIDAASNNRVDEIRDLKEKVNYLPAVGKYKVYIIDEVHMLTDSAFNALLKTLEEPPKHIIFILATTEPQKLPATILSRCMRFDFKLVTQPDLVNLLAKVFDKTNTTYEKSALEQIAKAGKGSVRDTLSVAEMVKSFTNGNITYDAVMQCLGLTDDKTLYELSNAILNKNGQVILDILEVLYNQGKNISVLISDLCNYFQTLLSVKFGCDIVKSLPENIANNYKLLAERAEQKYLLDCVKKLCDAENAIKFCTSEKAFAQTTLLSLFYDDNFEIAGLKKKLAELEVILNGGDIQKKTVVYSEPKQTQNIQTNLTTAEKDDNPFKTDSITKLNNNEHEIFGKIIKSAREQNEMMLFASLSDVEGVKINNGKFVFECKNQDCIDLINKNKQFILNILKDFGFLSYEAVLYIDKQQQQQEKLKNLFGEKLKIV